ncbi:hypothetical protein SRABI26_03833 [Arthrobacter sp. Bi26]|uniref:hypothetical protein n=1 Tax=Arthrobacter sp. Bi26 TaxID=2822350 RepID=UPI001D791A67|nr:hypothetical protein [Arthrobacter sp. Bi26]CAH0277070.1 hypothetical protein SRABI26_03833 [Arthrobacter sp. Bi26]
MSWTWHFIHGTCIKNRSSPAFKLPWSGASSDALLSGIRVPKGLDTADAVRNWLVSVLPETARLVREYLPRKSKSYPSEQLAAEIDGLREMLLRTEYVDRSPT